MTRSVLSHCVRFTIQQICVYLRCSLCAIKNATRYIFRHKHKPAQAIRDNNREEKLKEKCLKTYLFSSRDFIATTLSKKKVAVSDGCLSLSIHSSPHSTHNFASVLPPSAPPLPSHQALWCCVFFLFRFILCIQENPHYVLNFSSAH